MERYTHSISTNLGVDMHGNNISAGDHEIGLLARVEFID